MIVFPEKIEDFSQASVLVIGDLIVDQFIWGEVRRISPEAPVPVVDVRRENLMLGGAANVLNNIHSLGGRATLCGVVGDDAMADRLIGLVSDLDLPVDGIFRSDDRPTMVKTRVIAHSQQVVRFDREKRHPLPSACLQQIKSFLESQLDSFDAIVISDYAKGMICPEVMEVLRRWLAGNTAVPVIVDPKPGPGRLSLFQGMSVLTPNHAEAEMLAGMEISTDEQLVTAARRLLAETGCQAVLVTRGEAGMALLERDRGLYTIPTRAQEVFDVTGAGDTVVAVLSLGLASGMGFRLAAQLANYAAGIVVGKVGTATVNTEELKAVLKE